MKNIMFGMVLTAICVMTFVIVMTVSGRMVRAGQSEVSMQQAVEDALTQTMLHREYTIDDNEEFIADFLETYLSRVTNDADVEVQVMGIDFKNGLLSLRVISHFTNPNQSETTESYETTAIFSELREEEIVHTISFLADEDVDYVTYQTKEGSDFLLPKGTPAMEGKRFLYWMDTDTGKEAAFPHYVTEDKTYRAMYQSM